MRARNIKPGLFKNEILGTADPLLTILFEGLWCLADKLGRLEDRPLRIKAEVFPYRDKVDVNGYLTELARLGFIQRYSAGDLKLIQVNKFSEHQNPHHTEKNSTYPAPPKSNGELTVKPPEINGDTPADSLIPDSLIPDSNTPPNPLKGERKKRKKFSFEGYTSEVAEIVNYFNSKWPDTRRGDKSKIKLNNAVFADRIDAILKDGLTVAQIKAIGDMYLAEDPDWISCPHFFFGSGGKYLPYAKMLIHEQSKAVTQ